MIAYKQCEIHMFSNLQSTANTRYMQLGNKGIKE